MPAPLAPFMVFSTLTTLPSGESSPFVFTLKLQDREAATAVDHSNRHGLTRRLAVEQYRSILAVELREARQGALPPAACVGEFPR